MTCLYTASAPAQSDGKTTGRRGAILRVCAAVGALLAFSVGHAAAADWLDDSWLRGSLTSNSPARWDGIYFGAQIGVANMNTDFGNGTSGLIAFLLRNSTIETEASPSSWTTLPNNTTNGRSYGGFVGYNMQWDQLVLGLDAAYNRVSSFNASASDSIDRIVTTSDNVQHDVFIASQASLTLVDYATVRARAGYAIGQFLPYAVLGAAVGRFNYANSATVRDIQTPPAGAIVTFGPQTLTSAKDGAIVGGFVTGLGLDVAVLPNVFLRGEWEFVAFAPVGGIRSSLNSGRVGVGVRF